ncbi:MAG: hypothetical protein E7661_08865 [Ruminococcaceae bacterium]|nr:hypothetical protein [Oscillospiraceae bacterium]
MKMNCFNRVASLMLAILMLAATLVASLTLPVAADDKTVITYEGVNIKKHEGGYDHFERSLNTYVYDFQVTRPTYYAKQPELSLSNTENMDMSGETLACVDGGSFSFGSAIGLGDDYGLEKGELTFDLALTGGSVSVGVRTSKVSCTDTARGIWFVFDSSDKLTVKEPESGLSAQLDLGVSLSEAKSLTVKDNLDSIVLSCGETIIATVEYTKDGYLAVKDGQGTVKAEINSSKIYVSGYFEFYVNDLDGYIDNISFTNVAVDQTAEATGTDRVVDYRTWTAIDDLDRVVAVNTAESTVNENRYVGLFYFLCWVGAGGSVGDNTKLYVDGGMEGVLAHFDAKKGGEAYWAEPYFGYYINTDTWVYRKHAAMLEAAGVDFVYLDVSNAETFPIGHTALFDTWLQIRNEGGSTPQIVFFCGDNPSTLESNMNTLFRTVYSEENWEKYEELFFQWNGKPLLFGNGDGISASMKKKINDKFTLRGSWAWMDKNNYWSWLQEYTVNSAGAYRPVNGGWGRDAQGKYESLSIALGHHPTMSKGRTFVNGQQTNNGKNDMEFSSVYEAGLGTGFEFQFNAATSLIGKRVEEDTPFVLMITGWNEWIAGCSYTEPGQLQPMANGQYNFYYVDQFNAMFSRDAEPMRNYEGYGFGDNYYYQMCEYIRQYKGIDTLPVADHQTTVNIYDVESWKNIELAYTDTLHDVELRNSRCYDITYRYINNTGRNDFDYAKVSQDDKYLYFLVKCDNDIIVDNGSNWMNLFLDIDGDMTNGWGGYDLVLNRDRDSFAVKVEKFVNNAWEFETVGEALYAIDGQYMTVKLSKSLFGANGTLKNIKFKWADNSVDNGDPMAFMDLGDTAPDNRFSFSYVTESCETVAEDYTVQYVFDAHEAISGEDVGVPTKPIPEMTVVDIMALHDFESFTAGASVENGTFGEVFQIAKGTSNCYASVKKGDDGKYAEMSGYVDLRTWEDVKGAYNFVVDLKMIDYGNTYVFLRGEMPGIYKPYNPAQSSMANQEVHTTFNYFEWDWYAENGGNGSSSTAGSGFGFAPEKNGLVYHIKKYATDGLHIATAHGKVPYPAGFTYTEGEFISVKCEDSGEEIKIYLDGILAATMTLSNPGVVYETDGTGQQYYGLVELFDATGNSIVKVENSRLNSSGSQIALATRVQKLQFDNLGIGYSEESYDGTNMTSFSLNYKKGSDAWIPDHSLLDLLMSHEEQDETETVPPEDITELESDVDDEDDTEGTNTEPIGAESVTTDPTTTEAVTQKNEEIDDITEKEETVTSPEASTSAVTEATEGDGGCGSSVLSGITILALGATVIFIKKKKIK